MTEAIRSLNQAVEEARELGIEITIEADKESFVGSRPSFTAKAIIVWKLK
ncbi:hypothetical protein [Bradyrhizobium sp. DOA1]|nr:hypothetical protein [Bradyrhizobium sp. DOA1]